MDISNQYIVQVRESQPGESAVYRNPNQKDGLIQYESPELNTMQKLLLRTFQNHGDKASLGTINPDTNQYEYITYNQLKEQSQAIGSSLLELNLVPSVTDVSGIKILPVGIYSKNRSQWCIVDVACQLYGLTSVPFYDTLGVESIKYAIDLTQISVCFCQAHTAEIISKAEQLPSLKAIVLFEPIQPDLQAALEFRGLKIYSFQELLDLGKQSIKPLPEFESNRPLTVCFTSGTTGDPKAAVQTHSNFTAVTNVFNTDPNFQLKPDDVHLSFLPLPHTFERAVHLSLLASGSTICYFSGNILKISEDLQRAKPTIFCAVPRLFNRFYEGIQSKFAQLPEEQKAAVNQIVQVKLKKYHDTGDTTHEYDDKVFANTKALHGGRCRYMITGAAPISAEVLDFLKVVFCCPIIEGFGQTESTAASFLTKFSEKQSGFVGGPTSMCEFKLVDVPEMEYLSTDKDQNGNLTPRGEVCLKGPGIFAGYFNDKVRTNEAIDEEGWLHMGDIGVILPNGALKVIDRKKNLFKLAQGEYVSPEKIENSYIRTRGVLECFVHGESIQNHCVGVIVPEPIYLKKFAEENQIQGSIEELCQNPVIRKHYLENLQKQGKVDKLTGFEQVKTIYLEPLTFGQIGLLTDTQKLQRFQARKHYKAVIDKLYQEIQ